jgi:glutamine synthetase
MHTHFSLFEGEVNAFHDPGDEHGLSKVGKGFIAGLLHHAPELTAVTNQWVNSYKRLVPGWEAPIHVAWARNNASVIVNVPQSKKGRAAEATRIEYRAPDPACNPYLAYSCILAAGMRGIEEGYELPAEARENLHAVSPEELAKAGIRSLPGNLHDAVDLMEASDLVREALGDHVVEFFVKNKRQEWAEYKTQVSQFELDRYLPRL